MKKVEPTIVESKRSRWYRNEEGAIDLASIMVGIIVIGIVGGVVAATVFTVIPWSQDNAAKQQLKNVVDAQAVYRAANMDGKFASYDTLVKGAPVSAEGGSALPDLVTASASLVNLEGVNQPLSIVLNAEENCYVSVIQSESGKLFSATNAETNPASFERTTTPGCVDAVTLEENVAEVIKEEPIEMTSLMVSTWDISTTKTVQLPVQGTIGAGSTINWGDGTVEALTANPTHTYAAGSAATVTIDGSFGTWSMASAAYTAGPQLRTITKWDNKVGTTSLTSGFTKATGLTSVKKIPNTVKVLRSAFQDNTTFNGDISGWDTSSVTDMRNLFYRASVFNQPVNFNTSNVTDMSGMFFNAAKFNQPVNFDTSNVTTMNNMFSGALVFNQPVPFNTAKVTNMGLMFNNGGAFNQPVNFDTGNVTDMNAMFYNAQKFNRPVNFNTAKVTNMNNMFGGASVFNQPVEFDTTKVTRMNGMFSYTSAFNQPVNFNTANVTDMGSVFSSARAFNQPVSFDTTKVTNMDNMFYNATLFNQDISGWNVANVTTWMNFKINSSLSVDHTPAKFR